MTDAWQAGEILAGLLASAKWADGAQATILTAAFVSNDGDGDFAPNSSGFLDDGPPTYNPPFARIEPLPTEEDQDSPGRLKGIFRIHVTAGGGGIGGWPGTNDSHGINQETGANRDTSTGVLNAQGLSTGRSVDELVGRLVEVLGIASFPGYLVKSTHGVQGLVVGYGPRRPVDGNKVIKRTFDVEVYDLTASRDYPTALQFKATPAGGGTVNLSWLLPQGLKGRFDATGAGAAGLLKRGTNPSDPAPTSPTSGGTVIPITGGALGVAAADAGHSAGQIFNYAYWFGFTETPAARTAATPDRYSTAPALASVTVT